jgi:signal transduction histidine kinase
MLPYAWRLSVSIVRVALGIACLTLYIALSVAPLDWPLAPLLAFLGYALFALWRSMESEGNTFVMLLLDLAAFAAWVVFTGETAFGGAVWLGITSACYIYMVVEGVLSAEWPRVIGVVGICFGMVLALPWPTAVSLRPTVLWAGVLAAVWMIHRRLLEDRVAAASRHTVQFRSEAQRAREEERQRIAGDFHDGPLQSFIGFLMRLEILRKILERDADQAAEELRQLQELAKKQVGELRAFVRSMRPAEVEGSSLGASLSRMVEQFSKDTGIASTFLAGDPHEPPETEIALELLQIVREALNNIHKHSRASRIAVSVAKRGSYLEISVDDNGAGFPFAGSYTLDELDLLRLGPVSIRRRVRALGGELVLDSRPGQGSSIKVRIAAA